MKSYVMIISYCIYGDCKKKEKTFQNQIKIILNFNYQFNLWKKKDENLLIFNENYLT